MDNDLWLSIKNHTDKLIEQTRTQPHEMLVFKMNEQTETFPFSPPISLSEEQKELLSVTSFETTNSVFNITDKNNRSSTTTSVQWNSEDDEELINELNNFLKLRSENHVELYVKKSEKMGIWIESENSGYNLAGFDQFKSEILEELKRVKNYLEEVVYRMELTDDKIVDMLDVYYIAGSTIGYTIPPAIYESSDINLMIKSSLPNKVKVTIKIDEIRLRSNLSTNRTIKFI